MSLFVSCFSKTATGAQVGAGAQAVAGAVPKIKDEVVVYSIERQVSKFNIGPATC